MQGSSNSVESVFFNYPDILVWQNYLSSEVTKADRDTWNPIAFGQPRRHSGSIQRSSYELLGISYSSLVNLARIYTKIEL